MTNELVDKRKKIPQVKMFAHFSAGERAKNYLLKYNENKNENYVEQMLDSLKKGISKRLG